MSADALVSLEPRKTPLQARSAVTVEAIYEATIQVLLTNGIEQLTTTRIAARAGVSVGTLYQYYPNKQSLLWYDKARNYRLFEFVWDPTIDPITGQRIGTVPGQQIPGAVTPGTVNPNGPGTQGNNPVQTQNPPVNPNGPNTPDMPPLQAPPNP